MQDSSPPTAADKLTGTRHTVEAIKSLLLQEAVLFNWFIFLKHGLYEAWTVWGLQLQVLYL